MIASLITAFALLISAGCAMARHMLLNPQADRWRNAPQWYRAMLFVFTVGCTYLGLRFILAAKDGVDAVPPDATGATMVLAVLVMLYKVANLIRTWTRESWGAKISRYLATHEAAPYRLPGTFWRR